MPSRPRRLAGRGGRSGAGLRDPSGRPPPVRATRTRAGAKRSRSALLDPPRSRRPRGPTGRDDRAAAAEAIGALDDAGVEVLVTGGAALAWARYPAAPLGHCHTSTCSLRRASCRRPVRASAGDRGGGRPASALHPSGTRISLHTRLHRERPAPPRRPRRPLDPVQARGAARTPSARPTSWSRWPRRGRGLAPGFAGSQTAGSQAPAPTWTGTASRARDARSPHRSAVDTRRVARPERRARGPESAPNYARADAPGWASARADRSEPAAGQTGSVGHGAMPEPERPKKEWRGDIQGLRAVAVSLVVIYHLAAGRLNGGYVGVDVFFVISGFLITQLLSPSSSPTAGSTSVLLRPVAPPPPPASLLVIAVTVDRCAARDPAARASVGHEGRRGERALRLEHPLGGQRHELPQRPDAFSPAPLLDARARGALLPRLARAPPARRARGRGQRRAAAGDRDRRGLRQSRSQCRSG